MEQLTTSLTPMWIAWRLAIVTILTVISVARLFFGLGTQTPSSR